MVNKSFHPQEIELFYIMPALRREIAVCMKSAGLSQKKIAHLLGVTEPAVSQYFSAKRAKGVKFNKKISDAIKESSKNIVDAHSLISETQRLLHLARHEGVVCELHKKLGLKECNAEFCLCRPGANHG